MASPKFLLGLLAALYSLTFVLAADSFEKWAELPTCAKTCISFASGTGVPPGGQCSARNITCICQEPQWRTTCANCLSKGDTNGHQVPGCVDKDVDTINAILSYVSDVFCPTVNETKQVDPSYSSWSFTSAPAAATSSSTSVILHNATTTAITNSSTAMIATSVDSMSSHADSTSYTTTSISTVHASHTSDTSSASSSPTSTSGAAWQDYEVGPLALAAWAMVFA